MSVYDIMGLVFFLQFLEEYFQQYKIPFGIRISDGVWNELFSEVVKR